MSTLYISCAYFVHISSVEYILSDDNTMSSTKEKLKIQLGLTVINVNKATRSGRISRPSRKMKEAVNSAAMLYFTRGENLVVKNTTKRSTS